MSKKTPKKIPIKTVKVDAKSAERKKYVLKLFVTGILPNSSRAIINIKSICEKYLEGNYDLEIIDIYQQPEISIAENIIAIPLLIKKFPLPEERMIGDLSNTESVLKGLHLDN